MSQSDIICMSITDCNMYGHNEVNACSSMVCIKNIINIGKQAR